MSSIYLQMYTAIMDALKVAGTDSTRLTVLTGKCQIKVDLDDYDNVAAF